MTEISENLPRLSDDTTEIIWDAAQASNLAWDDWKNVEEYLLKGHGCSGANGYDATKQISEQARDAAFNFKLLSDFAGLAMRMPNSPFRIERPVDEKVEVDSSSLEGEDIPF